MWKKIIFLLILIVFYLLICHKIYIIYKPKTIEIKNNTLHTSETVRNNNSQILNQETIKTLISQEKPIGKLIINKINLSEDIYDIKSSKNNIEQHVTILEYSEEPSVKNSTFFIAAHSGTGPIAYFKNLNQLSINDIVSLEYKNITYTYKIKNIWTDEKTGTLTIPNENRNQLILTTCHPTKKNYQLTLNCILIT